MKSYAVPHDPRRRPRPPHRRRHVLRGRKAQAMTRPTPHDHTTRTAAVNLYATGKSLSAVARQFGVSKGAVSRWVDAAGIMRRVQLDQRAMDTSPTHYRGGWVRNGLVMRPLEPRRVR